MAMDFFQSNSMFGFKSLKIDYARKMKATLSQSNLKQITDPVSMESSFDDSTVDEISIRLDEWYPR